MNLPRTPQEREDAVWLSALVILTLTGLGWFLLALVRELWRAL